MTDFSDLLRASRRVLIFSGAGISTESGIPDFRSPGGIWSKIQPIYFQEFVASEHTRREAWRRRFSNADGWVGAKPNRGHFAVAELIRSGRASVVVTQNVDNLHQVSGVPEEKVIELHGNSTYAKCLKCQSRVELDELQREFEATNTVGPCKRCGGILKTATISFGQQMPELPMRRTQEETLACDLFLVLGSSLSVFPAADFPARAKQNGAKLVIVNRDPTPLDEIADLVIHDGIGDTMEAALARLS
ncbi:SIR2 family NAD-dependent protein deacylase [Steroidobacter agaridevorans]|uniref:SIR2 family NAD-dependent protein deacylase n=1 Tax=Steroidobacter agaridevorans TaxID=2695856 RepID=UPI00132BF4BA|nr:Sir2 family NAD-dependent protein deacetylase [Steroidobacter agaridevorans]GFE90229.1 NAD-dependent protein deacetylase 1 [Steroidobacter agaridevorans]